MYTYQVKYDDNVTDEFQAESIIDALRFAEETDGQPVRVVMVEEQ